MICDHSNTAQHSWYMQITLFMRTFIFSAHEGARLMKANLEHDHYQAGAVVSPHDDPKQFWQAVTVSAACNIAM